MRTGIRVTSSNYQRAARNPYRAVTTNKGNRPTAQWHKQEYCLYLRPTSVTWKQPDKFKCLSLNAGVGLCSREKLWRADLPAQSSMTGSVGSSALQVAWQVWFWTLMSLSLASFLTEVRFGLVVGLRWFGNDPPPRKMVDCCSCSERCRSFSGAFLQETCLLSSHPSSIVCWHSRRYASQMHSRMLTSSSVGDTCAGSLSLIFRSISSSACCLLWELSS